MLINHAVENNQEAFSKASSIPGNKNKSPTKTFLKNIKRRERKAVWENYFLLVAHLDLLDEKQMHS